MKRERERGRGGYEERISEEERMKSGKRLRGNEDWRLNEKELLEFLKFSFK